MSGPAVANQGRLHADEGGPPLRGNQLGWPGVLGHLPAVYAPHAVRRVQVEQIQAGPEGRPRMSTYVRRLLSARLANRTERLLPRQSAHLWPVIDHSQDQYHQVIVRWVGESSVLEDKQEAVR